MEELERNQEIIRIYLRKIEELEGEKKKTIEDLKKQLVEINNEANLAKMREKEEREKLRIEKEMKEKTLQVYEVELRRNVGRQGMEQIKRKAEQKLRRE